MKTSEQRIGDIGEAIARATSMERVARAARRTIGFAIDGNPTQLGEAEYLPESERPELPTAPSTTCAARITEVMES